MTKGFVLSGALLGCCLAAEGAARFCLPERIYAVSGVPCNVYFARTFDSVKYENYAFEALSEVGNFWIDRWSWTPTEEDAGTSRQLVLNAWTDDGCVASATTQVCVARQPSAALKARKITLALFGASGTNSRFQDQLFARMRAAGFARYTPVGSHTGRSSSLTCDPANGVPHDGYGGFAFGDFLTRYALSVDEIDNLQAEAERAQLLSFGVKIPAGQEWRRGLLKSPLVRLKDGKKVVDVQAWLDKINGGEQPDYLMIVLGGNGIATIRPDKIEESVARQLEGARKLVAEIHAVCPKTVILISGATGGSILQTGWGKNYGARIAAFQGNHNRIRYDETMAHYVRTSGDPLLRYVSIAQNIDPIGVYPLAEAEGNALHPSEEGGRMTGDALFAGLLYDLTEAERTSPTAASRDATAVFETAVSLTEPKVWTSPQGGTLPYRLHVPAAAEPGRRYPLVVHLHGAGARGTNNLDQIRTGGADVITWAKANGEEFIFLAPQCPKGKRWVDVDWGTTEHRMAKDPTPELRMALELIDDACARYPVDPTRIYLTGISMGGYGAWELLQRRPKLFAAAIPCCGGGDVTLACTLTDVAIWAFHGAKDKVVPSVRSRSMFEAVRGALSQKVRYREYPDAGHNVWTPTFSDEAVLSWLWRQRRADASVK